MARLPKRLLVTDAQCLRISDLKRAGVFAHPGEFHFISLAPVESATDVPRLACFYLPGVEGASLAVAHHASGPGHHQRVMRYWIGVHEMPGHFGGARRWFVCPGHRGALARQDIISRAGRGRTPQGRATALYLPPGGTQFRCRDCHQLTYRTKQFHYGAGAKSRPSSVRRATAPPPGSLLSIGAARLQLVRRLQDALNTLGQGKDDPMSQPELTLRQQVVWYLWGLRRVRIEQISELFGVTPRTICRDIAVLRERGWRRPRAKDTPAQLSLDLIVEVRTRLDAAFRTAYAGLPTSRPRAEREAMLSGLQQATRMDADLVLSASQLVQAMQREHASLRTEQTEAMRQELAAQLATMLGP
jgi:hypothetical protein